MSGRRTRRGMLRVLCGTAVASLASSGVVGATGANERSGSRAFSELRTSPDDPTAPFVPTDDAFGFRNWSTRTMAFDPPPIDEPSPPAVRDRIGSNWSSPAARFLNLDLGGVPNSLVDAITIQAWAALAHRTGTNGHCYGISLAAQRYYEQPEEIPLDRERASDFVDPIEPIDDPNEAPVYSDIVRLQAQQFLQFRSWLGRRLMLVPDRINYDAQLDALEAVIGRYGTASISVFDGPFSGHQILAYDVEERDDGIVVLVYDPNWAAPRYERSRPRVRLERTDDGLSMDTYAGKYTDFVFNRFDRVEAATGRESPLEFVDFGPETVLDSLFPMLVVTVDSPDVDVNIADPNGGRLGRIRSEFADRTRGSIGTIRSRYGSDPGEYRIALVGQRATDYELRAVAATPDANVLDRTVTGSIAAGETRTYVATIPSDGGEGTVEPVDGSRSLWPVVLGAVGGVAVGAGVYRKLRGGCDCGDADDPPNGQ